MTNETESADDCGVTRKGQMADILNGPRLTLRPLRLDDAADFAKFMGDYDISRMTGSIPRHFPQISAEFKIMHMRAQKRRGLSFNYAVTLRGDDQLIGIVDLFRSAPDEILEIGYSIAKPYWGHNYASEAGHLILKAAREQLGVTRIKAGVFVDNPASLRVLEKLGFEKFGPVEPFFSMARMENVASINMELNLTDEIHLPWLDGGIELSNPAHVIGTNLQARQV